jgi:hypothetical protein
VKNANMTFAEGSNLSSAELCMGRNAVSAFGQPDADLTGVTRSDAATQCPSLIGVLAKANKQGELSSDVDLDVMAAFIESNLAGIGMAAKAGNSRHALGKIVVFAGRSYLKAGRQI